MADELQRETDYLGRDVPVSLSGKPSLPVGGAPVGVAAGPQTSATGTVPSPATLDAGNLGGGITSEAGGWSTPSGTPFGPSQILSLLGQGFRIQDLAERLFGSGPTPPGLTGGEVSAQGGEGGVATGIDQAVNEGLAGDAGTGIAEAVGGFAPETLSGALGVLGTAAPIWAGLTAAVDFLGEGTIPFRGLLNSIFGFDDPSAAWRSYGGRLHDTFAGYETANRTLAEALAGASTPDQIKAAVEAWRGSTRAPGEGLEIGDLPGATGSPHEWKQRVDFSPEVFGLREELQAALRGAPADQRIQALMSAAQSRRDFLSKQQADLDAQEAQRQLDADAASRMVASSSA